MQCKLFFLWVIEQRINKLAENESLLCSTCYFPIMLWEIDGVFCYKQYTDIMAWFFVFFLFPRYLDHSSNVRKLSYDIGWCTYLWNLWIYWWREGSWMSNSSLSYRGSSGAFISRSNWPTCKFCHRSFWESELLLSYSFYTCKICVIYSYCFLQILFGYRHWY